MRQRRTGGPGAADAGSVTLEAVIIAPVIILLATVAVVLGRVETFHAAVQQAAQAAARAGSVSRTATTAQTNAKATWNGLMGTDPASTTPNNDIHCTSAPPTTDTTVFDQAAGSATAKVDWQNATSPANAGAMFVFRGTCTLQSKWLLGVFGTDITVTETAYSPVDPYRCRADKC